MIDSNIYFKEKDLSSVDSMEFQKMLDVRASEFADDEVKKSFQRLISFVKAWGHLVGEKAEDKSEIPIKYGKNLRFNFDKLF